jgi:predicted ATP-binding protein involved in virulence
MDPFVTKIRVNEVFHLRDFEIDIAGNDKKHLILTGKNGTGKTVLLRAILDCFETLGKGLPCRSDKVTLFFNDPEGIREGVNRHIILAYYAAERVTRMYETLNPMKPDMNPVHRLEDSKTDQFLYFLSDYKIQEALARNERKTEEADEINKWFISFTGLLKELFEDEHLKLTFNYKDYSFHIETQGKSFKFTELSAGYSAVLDIVADLILKMQTKDSCTRVYNKPGIVLIDEIETHLHLELQRVILPILTRIFPSIQFIVTTHSPFILNSLKNATVFDLETRTAISDLTDYSYEALAEGYFGVRTESSNAEVRLRRLRELVHSEQLTLSDSMEMRELMDDFEKAPEFAAPHIKAEYNMLKLESGKKGRCNDQTL